MDLMSYLFKKKNESPEEENRRTVALKLYFNPTKESALEELESRLLDVNIVLKNPQQYILSGNSDSIEAENKNKNIIERDIRAIKNGINPKKVMEKYHNGKGQLYGLSGYQLYKYNPATPNSIPEVL